MVDSKLFAAAILMAGLIGAVLVAPSTAQSPPLPLGQLQPTLQLYSCPAGFYAGTETNRATCYVAEVSCPSADPASLTFSYINGNAPNAPIGTIVLFNSGGGEMTLTDNNSGMASDYAAAGYAVVQTSWGTDWEDTNQGYEMLLPPPPSNIRTAACRPATFLNYIATASQYHSSGTAMCAQGASAGSAALAYSITWYGVGSQLNATELLAGPVLSNIQIGCQVGGTPPPATCAVICQSGACGGSGPCGSQACLSGSAASCSQGTLSEIASMGSWTGAPQYLGSYATAVEGWTGNMSPACNKGSTTTGAENLSWYQQSIVGPSGVFSWPSTLEGMGGWACYSYQNNNNCFTTGSECPNNSGPEGEQFYIAVNSSGGTPPTGYIVTGIQQCNGAEGVGDPLSKDPDNPSWNGMVAIENHMETNCKAPH